MGKHLAELRGQEVLFGEQSGEGDQEKKRQECRTHLLKIISDNPTLTRSQIRALAVMEYFWLYRNDKAWLEKHLPPTRSAKYNFKPKVDWPKRDEDLSAKIANAAAHIKDLPGKPVRITLKEIRHAVGQKGLSSVMLQRLPKTRAAIEAVAESIEDFQIRRVKYVVDQICRNGEPLSKRQIIGKAGLNNGCSERVQKEIEVLLTARPGVDQMPLFDH